MRRFQLVRTTDVTGVSSEGVVAEGCQFGDGTAVVHWLGERVSTVVWRSVDDAYHVHGHAASTQFRWLDDENEAIADLNPATVWVVPKVPAEPGYTTSHGTVLALNPDRAELAPSRRPVLHEDDAFLTIEVTKQDDRPLQVEAGDRYLTLLFVRNSPTDADPRRVVAWGTT